MAWQKFLRGKINHFGLTISGNIFLSLPPPTSLSFPHSAAEILRTELAPFVLLSVHHLYIFICSTYCR